MNISRVSNVNFGKIHLSANLKEDIVKNRPGADEKQLIKKDIKWVEDEKQRQIEKKKRQEELDKIWEEKRKIELEKQQKILEAQNQLESNNKFFTDFMA